MLHFRNTYKNCKIMLLYMFMAILFLVVSALSLLICFIPELKVIGIVLFIVSFIIFVINFFLIIMKNNDYKLKNYFKLGTFYKEFKKLEKVSKGNKRTLRQIKKDQKDYFLQFGKLFEQSKDFSLDNNNWNNWVEDAVAFSYPNSKYMEKLSYLTYILFNACSSGAGLEEFFNYLKYEPFTKDEIIEIITKNDFFNIEFKSFIVKIVNEYSKENEDKLFERYELIDNKEFFKFEQDLYDCASWIAYNRKLLSSCVGVYLGKLDYTIYRLFLSKDYNSLVIIYSEDDKVFKVANKMWDAYDFWWDGVYDVLSFDSEETAFNGIKEKVKDYIELDI